MTEIEALRERVAGKCTRCGRLYLTLPADGINHYIAAIFRTRDHPRDQPVCGGVVAALSQEEPGRR